MLKKRIPAAVTVLALLSNLGGVDAAEKQTVQTKTVSTTTVDEFHTSGHIPVRRYIGDMTLEQAVNLALRQNPQVLTAIQEIERTRGLIIEVRAAALPQITASGIYQQQDRRLIRSSGFGGNAGGAGANNGLNANALNQLGNTLAGVSQAGGGGAGTAAGGNLGAGVAGGNANAGAGQSTTSNDELVNQLSALFGGSQSSNTNRYIQNKSWNVSIEARQAIYAGGQIRAAMRVAQLTSDSAYFSLRDVIDSVISTTRQQFYNVLLTRALIIVQEESVRLLEQQRQDQQNRFEAGTVPRFNVLQAEVALSNARPDLIRARNNYLLSQILLARTLNLDAGPAMKPSFHCVGVLNASLRSINLTDAIALARARRPFLKVQRQTILIDVENVTVQMAGYKPRIDASGGYLFRNRAGAEDLSDVVNGWFFGVTGNWDIFDGFATYGL
jgi:outer membrane protein TolC